MKRKSWRRIKSTNHSVILIRKICCCILILELAFLVKESGEPVLSFQEYMEETKGKQEDVYGIRFRLKEGRLEFYHSDDSIPVRERYE